MSDVTSGSQRADHIYRIGLETLVAQSFAIYIGKASQYAKRSLEMSQPGPDGFPLKWAVSGEIDKPDALKGSLPVGPVTFTRLEQSGMLPKPSSTIDWELEFGDLTPEDHVVLFLQGDPAKPELKVLPSDNGDRNLASLVRDIVRIQAVVNPSQQITAWLSYLETAPVDEGRRAALRALIATPAVDWALIQPALLRVLTNPGRSFAIRAFSFGIIAFAVIQEKWGTQQLDAVEFLCRQFEVERDSRVALQQILALKLVLRYTSEEASAATRQTLRQSIFACLNRRATRVPFPPELHQQWQQIRAAYPGQF